MFNSSVRHRTQVCFLLEVRLSLGVGVMSGTVATYLWLSFSEPEPHTSALLLTFLHPCSVYFQVWMFSYEAGLLLTKNLSPEKRLEGFPLCFNMVRISVSFRTFESKMHLLRLVTGNCGGGWFC